MELDLGTSVELGSNVYEQETLYAETNQKKALVTDQVVAEVSKGGDLAEAVESTSTSSVEEIKLANASEYVANESKLITNTVEQAAINGDENLPSIASNAQKAFVGLDEKRTATITPYLNWVNQLEGSEKLTQEERESIAIDTAFLQAIAKGADKRAWYENAWDILGLMAVPDESYNVAEVEQQILGDTTGFKDWLGSGDAMLNIAEFRQTLSSAERVVFDEKLAESITNVDDNKLQQIMLAMNVLGRDPDSRGFQAMEKLDLLLVGSSLGHGLFQALKSMNVLNRTAKAGDARAASKIADAVTADPEIAKEAGVTQLEAALVGNPVVPKGLFKGAPEGVQKKYRDYSENVNEAINRAINTAGYAIELGTKDADEIVAAMNRNLSKRDDIENIKVHRTRSGVMFEYDVIEPDGTTRIERETREYLLDDLGGFQDGGSGFIASTLRPFTSPNTMAGVDRDIFVKGAEASLYAKGRVSANLAGAVDAALAPVGSSVKKLRNISDMLIHLDGRDIKPDYQTLVLDGVGGKRLSDDEFIAFTGVRSVLDDTWFLNNTTLQREMKLRGVKEVDLGDGTSIYSRPAGDADTAYTMFSGDVDNTIIVMGDEVFKGVGLDEMKALYKQGKVLVKSDATNVQEWFDSPSGKVRYALVDKNSVKELPEVVLNKQPNYLPKLREDANFFIKKQEDIVVNGAVKKVEKTIAYATTKTQADNYLAKLFKAAQEAGEPLDPKLFDVRFDREISKGVVNSDTITMQGGLIRGKRKSSELEYAGDFEQGVRTDALDSIQRYMAVTADRHSLSEWRLQARTMLANEAASHPEIGDKAHQLSWQALRGEIADSGVDMQQRAKMLSMYDQISEMSNIPSASDQRFQGLVKSVGMKIDKASPKLGKLSPVAQGIAKHIYRIHDKSLTDFLKGITFNLTLGMFNVVQIPVQLLGATVAASIRPVEATKALPKWLAASALDFATNEKTANSFLRKMSKDLKLPIEELQNDYNFWRRSGMYESVVRGSADASSLASHLPYDAGVIRRGFNKMVDAGQTPYRMGELSNMRISFFTALEETKKLKGKNFKYGDTTLQEVVGRAEQFRLNMSGANKANFQKGIWALPTQFKQIYGKYIEAVTGTHFTPRERTRLIVGQALLFGAAGVPILNHYTDQALDFLGFQDLNLTEEELTIVKRGSVGWLINSNMDIDALVSGRLTVSADVLEDFRRALLDTNTPALKTALGATFTTGDKFWDLFTNTMFAGNLIIDDYLEGEDTAPARKAAAEILARSAANLPASSRKWLAAWDLTEGMVRKSDGSLLYSTEPELADIYARAIGFGSQDTDDLYQLRQAEVKRKDKIKILATRYTALLHDLGNAVTNQDEANVEANQIAATLVKQHIYSLGREDADAVMDMVLSRLSSGRDFKEETLRKAIDTMTSEFVGDANKFSIIKKKYEEENNLGQ